MSEDESQGLRVEERKLGRGGYGGVVGRILDIWLPSFLLPWNSRVRRAYSVVFHFFGLYRSVILIWSAGIQETYCGSLGPNMVRAAPLSFVKLIRGFANILKMRDARR
jgi:hypothetical protein